MDNSIYILNGDYLGDLITIKTDSSNHFLKDPRCAISELVILCYLRKPTVYTCYIGDSVHFIVTRQSSLRK